MFAVGHVSRRRDLHAAFGGQQQGGISTPAGGSIILLFTGDHGEDYGYSDGWNQDGTFRYSGEGQRGDMKFVRGNAAIRDHAANGKDLHLFQSMAGGRVRYIGQMEYVGHDLVDEVPDRAGKPQQAIHFRLRTVSS